MYICLNCNSDVELTDELGRIRCPFCGHKLLAKKRAPVVKVTKAR